MSSRLAFVQVNFDDGIPVRSASQNLLASNPKQYVLRIAGINHNDPSMRQRLIQWLTTCAKYGNPDFVGVEWDRDIYGRVRDQRERFSQLLRRQWVFR